MPIGDSVLSKLDCGPELLALARGVEAAGGKLWAVGGTTRDALLGLARREWDLATDLDIAEVLELLGADADVTIESELGAVATRLDGCECVITRLREEADYGARRRPRAVRFIDDPVADALRRDFSINSLYLSLPEGLLLDPCDGEADLSEAWLRVIGDPQRRFEEDPLRVLRGIRFAARFDLMIDPETRSGLRAAAAGCAELSASRLRAELETALSGPGRGRAILLAQQLGVLAAILPELAERGAESWLWVARLLEELEDPDPAEIWSAVAGDPATGAMLATRLELPRALRRGVEDRLALSTQLAAWEDAARGRRRELLRQHWRADAERFLHACARAWLLPGSRFETLRRDLQHLQADGARPLIRGADVLAAGVPAGPRVGVVLNEIRAALNSGAISGRAAALAMLRRLVTTPVKPGPGGGR